MEIKTKKKTCLIDGKNITYDMLYVDVFGEEVELFPNKFKKGYRAIISKIIEVEKRGGEKK